MSYMKQFALELEEALDSYNRDLSTNIAVTNCLPFPSAPHRDTHPRKSGSTDARALQPLFALAESDGYVPALGADGAIYIQSPAGHTAFPTNRTLESIDLRDDEPLHDEFEAARAAFEVLLDAYAAELDSYAAVTYPDLRISARIGKASISFCAQVVAHVPERYQDGEVADFGCGGSPLIELGDINWHDPDTRAVDEAAARIHGIGKWYLA